MDENMDEKSVRIRLKFQDLEIFTSQQIEQGLAQSWYLVKLEDVHTIADVAFDIRAAFHLERSCPNGLGLEVDGFVLPASQPANLLKTSDLVRIKRRNGNQGSRGQISHEAWNGLIARKEWLASGIHRLTGHHGVELRALDEFEKETGGYESEEEGGEMETDISLDGEKTLEEARTTPICVKEKDRSEKKQKDAKTVLSEVGKFRGTKDKESRLELALTEVKPKCKSAVDHGVSQGERVEDHPLEQFQDEMGNDEDENEAVTTSPCDGKTSQTKFKAASLGTERKQAQSGKKRKKAKKGNNEVQDHVLQKEECGHPSVDGVQCISETPKDCQQKVKRKKLNNSDAHHISADVKLMVDKQHIKMVADCEDELKEGTSISRKKKRSAEVSLGGMSKPNGARESTPKKGKAEDKMETPSKKSRTPDVIGGSTSPRIPKGETNETEVDVEQRPSRSARRKKAKRKWLREQAKTALLPDVDTHVSKSNGSKIQTGGEPKVLAMEAAIEVEAEEEVLPIVVRAGHIRFEPVDKGETPDQCGHTSPMLWLGDQLKTKRQGQNWGQERSEIHKGKRLATRSYSVQSLALPFDERCNTMDNVNFENLLPLEGVPQEGDVLAYRLVELTASWTPEISPYRVGVVVHWDHSTNVIKLDLHHTSPEMMSLKDDEDLDSEQEKALVAPYDENGSLEVELSSLMDVRLMWRNSPKNHKVVPGPIVEIGEELDPTAAGHQVDTVTPEPVTEAADINATVVEHQDREDVERGHGAQSSPAWQDLVSEELERKKMELCKKGGVDTSASNETMAPSEDAPDQQESPKNITDDGMPDHGWRTTKGRKYKHLKSAGVGTIVALLRAQQAL